MRYDIGSGDKRSSRYRTKKRILGQEVMYLVRVEKALILTQKA